ncbi:MAG: CocE/NonD family hydrolase [Betaproteobacteria bacterium]
MVREEKWVPDGCVCVRVDSRGAGRSPGTLCHNNACETQDIYECVEWAAAQRWCDGSVGMNGISWEGWNDACRESARHGGILCSFRENWQDMQVKTVQHGVAGGRKNPNTGVAVCGDEILSDAELEKNRENMWQAFLSRGNFEGFMRAGSKQKWLEVHGGSHWAPFCACRARSSCSGTGTNGRWRARSGHASTSSLRSCRWEKPRQGLKERSRTTRWVTA